MRIREFGLVAVGRFMAVESYCQSHQSPSTHPLQGSSRDRTGGQADTRYKTSSPSAPARPEHG
jgi:hypothetical protein